MYFIHFIITGTQDAGYGRTEAEPVEKSREIIMLCYHEKRGNRNLSWVVCYYFGIFVKNFRIVYGAGVHHLFMLRTDLVSFITVVSESRQNGVLVMQLGQWILV